MRILIIDDYKGIVELMKTMLPDTLEVDTAENGADALARVLASFEESPYDVIFMDIAMPVIDGRSAVRAIRKAEKERGIQSGDAVKVIMATASSDNSTASGSLHRDGCDGYVVKPISMTAIRRALREVGCVLSQTA